MAISPSSHPPSNGQSLENGTSTYDRSPEDRDNRSEDTPDAKLGPAEMEPADPGDDQLEGAAGAEISVGTVAPKKKAKKKKPKSQRGLVSDSSAPVDRLRANL